MIAIFIMLLQTAQCDSIPIVIIQHGIREKPYNDTLACSWFKFEDDTVSVVEYRTNGVKVYRGDRSGKYYSRRFYTILRKPVGNMVFILRRDFF